MVEVSPQKGMARRPFAVLGIPILILLFLADAVEHPVLIAVVVDSLDACAHELAASPVFRYSKRSNTRSGVPAGLGQYVYQPGPAGIVDGGTVGITGIVGAGNKSSTSASGQFAFYLSQRLGPHGGEADSTVACGKIVEAIVPVPNGEKHPG